MTKTEALNAARVLIARSLKTLTDPQPSQEELSDSLNESLEIVDKAIDILAQESDPDDLHDKMCQIGFYVHFRDEIGSYALMQKIAKLVAEVHAHTWSPTKGFIKKKKR